MNKLINFIIILSLVLFIIICILYKLDNFRINNYGLDINNLFYNSRVNENFANDDICSVQLTNINPMFVKNYMKYDGKQIKCFNGLSSKAFCVGGKLKMDVKPIGVDNNGIPLEGKQSAIITNSNGSTPPENAIIPIDPWEFPNFFCLE